MAVKKFAPNSTESDWKTLGFDLTDEIIDIDVAEKLNTAFRVTLTFDIDSEKGNTINYNDIIVCPTNNIVDGEVFAYEPFRVKSIRKDLDSIEIYAEHIDFDLADNFIESCVIDNLAGNLAGDKILKSTVVPHDFKFESTIVDSGSMIIEDVDPLTALIGEEKSFLTNYKADVVFHNNTIKMVKSRGENRGVIIEYGKNLEGVDFTVDFTDTFTRAYPVASNGEYVLPEKYVDSTKINDYPHIIVKQLDLGSLTVTSPSYRKNKHVYKFTAQETTTVTLEFRFGRDEDYKLHEVSFSNITMKDTSQKGDDVVELISNGKFSDGHKGWEFTGVTPSAVRVENGYCVVPVEDFKSSGIVTLEGVAMRQLNIPVTAGKEYQISFETSSTIDRTGKVIIVSKDKAYINESIVFNKPLEPGETLKEKSETQFDSLVELYQYMRDYCNRLFLEDKVDEPKVTINLDVIVLTSTDEYKNFASERIWVGDTIRAKYSKINLDTYARCVESHFNPITKEVTSLVIGTEESYFSKNVNSTKGSVLTSSDVDSIKDIIANGGGMVEGGNQGNTTVDTDAIIDEAVRQATEIINNGLGGYVVKTRDEILIMDTDDVNTALVITRMNKNGIAVSTTGYGGPWYGLVVGGKLIIDEGTCNKFTASLINAGMLKSVDSSSWFNLEDGTFSWANGQIVFDGNKLSIMIENQSINDLLQSSFNILVNKEHQIIPLDVNNYPMATKEYNFTFNVLKGNSTTSTPCIINKVTPSNNVEGISYTFNGNTLTMKVNKDSRLLAITEGYVDVEIEVINYILSKRITWSTTINGRDGVDGVAGTPGISSYIHFMFAPSDTPTANQMTKTPQKYMGTYTDSIKEDSRDPSKYTWIKVMGDDGTSVRIDGHVPNSEALNDILNPEIGAGYINDTDGHLWVFTSTGWTDVGRIQGEQGIPGKPGTDGKTPYFHVKYSDDGGKTFTGNNGETPGKYMGTYSDFNEMDSSEVSRYTWVRIQGLDGNNPSLVSIEATSPIFALAKGATSYSPSSIKLTPLFENCTFSKWQYSINNGASWTNIVSGQNGLTIVDNVLTIANTCSLYTSTINSVMFKVYANEGSSDTISIFRLKDGNDGNNGVNGNDGAPGKDGVDGQDGTPGVDATTVYIANESHTFKADKNGNADPTSISFDIKGFVGTRPSNVNVVSVTGLPTGMTHSIANNNSTNTKCTINVTRQLNTVAGTVDLTISCNGLTFKKVFSYSLAVTGATGATGSQGIPGTSSYFHIKYSEVSNPTTSAQLKEYPCEYCGTYVDTNPQDSTNPADYTWFKLQGSDGLNGKDGNNGADGLPGKDGADGTTYYYHVKYSNDGSSFVPAGTYNGVKYELGEYPGDWLGILVDTVKEDSTTFSKYTWKKIKGDDGANASYVRISATGQIFSKVKGSTYYSPTNIKLTPTTTNCAYARWQYSLDGIVWNSVDGSNGLSISNGVLTVSNNCNLFTNTQTSIAFKVTCTNNATDTITIIRVQDGIDGDKGDTGASGANAVNIQLSNENHTFEGTSDGRAKNSSIIINIFGFEGITAKPCSIGTISGNPAGMTVSKNNSGTTSASITVNVTSAMNTRNGIISIPITCAGITVTKRFTYSLAIPGKDGVDGQDGLQGTPASYVTIAPTSLFFKCPADSSTYSPSSIKLNPTFTNCSYISWEYSIDGGLTWTGVSSGTNGLNVLNKVLEISSTSPLFTTTITSIGFRVNATNNKNDIVTITRLKDGNTGATGATGQPAVNVLLENESHTFAASSNGKAVATTISFKVLGYVGSKISNTSVGSISGAPTGMTLSVSSNNTLNTTITVVVTTSLTSKSGVITIPVTCGGVTVSKKFSYSLAIAGTDGVDGTNGTNAVLVKINSPTNMFKSSNGGTTFSPSTIKLTPSFQNCSYYRWMYSIDGSSWNTVVSGSNNLSISGNDLTISYNCTLYNTTVSAVMFRVYCTDTSIYDTLTVYKLIDRADINDVIKDMQLSVTQTANKWEAAFKNSNATNLLLNSDAKFGDDGTWISNGGGYTVEKANAFPFWGNVENYHKTSFKDGLRYGIDVQLMPDTDYVYEGYVYVDTSYTGNASTPLTLWTWKGSTPTQSSPQHTIIDYRQNLTSGRFSKVYIHFKTANLAAPIYGRFFVSGTSSVASVGCKRMSLKVSTVETEWTANSNEVYTSSITITENGLRANHSDAGTFTQMNAHGYSINDATTGDTIAWLSSKGQWTEAKFDKVFAGNIENKYEGPNTLYVDHSKTVAGEGTASKPFNSFASLQEYLEPTPVINYDLNIIVRDPRVEINEQFYLHDLKGTGSIYITLEGNLVIRSGGMGVPAVRFSQIDKWVKFISGREFGSATTGAVICDNPNNGGGGHGIFATDVRKLEVDAMTIACKNWGILAERTDLYTWHIDFGKCYTAVELRFMSIYYSSDDVGSCANFCLIKSGSKAFWGYEGGTPHRPQGNCTASNGIYYSHGSCTPTPSTRFGGGNPEPPSSSQVHTSSFDWTSHKTYAYNWNNWSDNDCKQGSWGYGLRGGHMFFDIGAIRSWMGNGVVQDGNTITLTRASSGGLSGGAKVYINGSNCSGPSGTPSYGNQTYLGTLAWGQTQTFTLPRGIVEGLKNGSFNSLAVYVNSSAQDCYLNITYAKITLRVSK